MGRPTVRMPTPIMNSWVITCGSNQSRQLQCPCRHLPVTGLKSDSSSLCCLLRQCRLHLCSAQRKTESSEQRRQGTHMACIQTAAAPTFAVLAACRTALTRGCFTAGGARVLPPAHNYSYVFTRSCRVVPCSNGGSHVAHVPCKLHETF